MQKSFVLSLLSILAIAQQANGISVKEFKRNNKNVAANFYDSAGVIPGSVGKCNLGAPTKEGFPMEIKGIDGTVGVSPEMYADGMCGMCIDAKDNADGFISLAGAGQNIGDVIVDQVTNMAPKLGEEAQKVVDKLKKGETTTEYPQALASVFSIDIQPFMINWMQYNPTEIISELKIPILIVNGTKDLQVSEEEAQLLKDANEAAELKIIENMNHVFFEIKGDDLENSKSYNEAFRLISPELIESIVEFIGS